MAYSFLQNGQPVKAQPWGKTWNPQLSDETGRRQLHATDVEFQAPTREAARIALQRSMSQIDPEDEAANNAIRSAFGERLAGLQGGMAQRKGQLESDLSLGFKNQLAELRRQTGGTGTMGSSTMGSQVGDLASQYQNNRAKALLDLESQGLDELGQVQQGLGSAYGQDLNERKYQLAQSGALSDLLMRQIAGDEARTSGLRGAEQAQSNADRAFWAGIFSSLAEGGTRIATGGAGGGGGAAGGGGAVGGMGYSQPNYWNSQVNAPLGYRGY